MRGNLTYESVARDPFRCFDPIGHICETDESRVAGPVGLSKLCNSPVDPKSLNVCLASAENGESYR